MGIRGVFHNGKTHIKSGSNVAGAAYYICESRGPDAWDLLIKNDKIRATVKVTDVFDQSSSCKVIFAKRTIEDIEKLLPDLLKVI